MNQCLDELIAKIPEQYQDIYGHSEFNKKSSRSCSERAEWVKRIIQAIQKKTGKKVLKILDLGCAQGYYSFVAAKEGCSVFGIDMLDANISVCKCLREELNADCTFHVGTVQDIVDTLQDQEYDIIFLFSVIHHICNEHGFLYARKVFEKLMKKTSCILTEMALKEEPLYWNKNLPVQYCDWFINIGFFDELAFFDTHLSDIKRPLIFASNRWCLVENNLYEVDEQQKNSFAGKPDDPGRNYYFCENKKYFIKLYRDVDPALLSEMRSEIDNLKKLNGISFAPRLLAFSDRKDRVLEISEIRYGSLLWNSIEKKKSLNYQQIFLDILDNLIELEKHGYYHGDLRSWNVCLDEKQHAFLIDFGALTTKDEDIVAENQYGFNGVKISTKRAFISLIYDCLINNTYPSIGRYGAYDLSLFYDFERIPKQFAAFICKYLINEITIESFEEIKELYQSIVIEENACEFSITELYQLLKSQNKAIFYEKASYTNGVPRDIYNQCIAGLEARIAGLEARIVDQNNHMTIIAEWANNALFEARIACHK